MRSPHLLRAAGALALFCCAFFAVRCAFTQQPDGQPPQMDGNGPPSGGGPGGNTRELEKKLNLSADQKTVFDAAIKQQREDSHAVFSDNSLSREDQHAKLTAIEEQTAARIRAILDDTQKAIYDEWLTQQRERREQHQQDSNSDMQGPPEGVAGPPPM